MQLHGLPHPCRIQDTIRSDTASFGHLVSRSDRRTAACCRKPSVKPPHGTVERRDTEIRHTETQTVRQSSLLPETAHVPEPRPERNTGEPCGPKSPFRQRPSEYARKQAALRIGRKHSCTTGQSGSPETVPERLPATAPFRPHPLRRAEKENGSNEKGMPARHPFRSSDLRIIRFRPAGRFPKRYRLRSRRYARPFLRNPKRCCSPSSSLPERPHPGRPSPCRLP